MHPSLRTKGGFGRGALGCRGRLALGLAGLAGLAGLVIVFLTRVDFRCLGGDLGELGPDLGGEDLGELGPDLGGEDLGELEVDLGEADFGEELPVSALSPMRFFGVSNNMRFKGGLESGELESGELEVKSGEELSYCFVKSRALGLIIVINVLVGDGDDLDERDFLEEVLLS